MSVRVSAAVWGGSDQSGSNLLVLLALADMAKDNGFAWPGKKYLAWRVRISQRQVIRICGQLVESGELELAREGGGSRANLYRVNVEHLQEKERERSVHPDAVDDADTRDIGSWGVTVTALNGPPVTGEPLTPTPEETSDNRQEKHQEKRIGDGVSTFPGMEPPVKPPPDDVDDLDEKVGLVWAHWLEVFGGTMRVKELTPPRRRAFAKALKAVGGDVALMNRAIDGLKSWREKNPGTIQPSTIFETGPNSVSNLTDQIEWWASHAKTTLLVSEDSDRIPLDLSTVPSVTKGTIQARRREVMMMLAHPSERTIRERGEAAVDWLKEQTGHEPIIEGGEFKGWQHVGGGS